MSLQRGMGAIALLGILTGLGLSSCDNSPFATGSGNSTSGAVVESQTLRFNNPFPQSSVTVEDVAEIPLNPETPPDDETPAHEEFTLTNISPQGDAVVRVYPTVSFAAFEFEGEKAALETLLRDRPNLETQETLPYLPQVAASQVFFAQPQYIEFAGGAGIRYITYYAFDVSPIRSDGLFYTFQGLTEDGQYYISAQIPLNTDLLPTPPDSANEITFAEQYASYLAEIIARLNQGTGAEFEPNLEQLDQMFGSLESVI